MRNCRFRNACTLRGHLEYRDLKFFSTVAYNSLEKIRGLEKLEILEIIFDTESEELMDSFFAVRSQTLKELYCRLSSKFSQNWCSPTGLQRKIIRFCGDTLEKLSIEIPESIDARPMKILAYDLLENCEKLKSVELICDSIIVNKILKNMVDNIFTRIWWIIFFDNFT